MKEQEKILQPRAIVEARGYTNYLTKALNTNVIFTEQQASVYGLPSARSYNTVWYEFYLEIYETKNIAKIYSPECGMNPETGLNIGYELTNPVKGLYILKTWVMEITYADSKFVLVPNNGIGIDPIILQTKLKWRYFVEED